MRPRLLRLLPVLVFGVCVSASQASEPRVSATMITSAVSIQNGVADATFRIEVKNDEDAALSDVFVIFADDIQLAVGSVAAAASASSEEMTRSFNVAETPSKYTPIPVTLKYSVDGVAVETAVTVTLTAEQQP